MKKVFRPSKIAIYMIVLFLGITSWVGQVSAMETASKDIVAIAKDNKELSTLVKALQAADLVGALQGEGPFTVFAPTDRAFSQLPAGTLDKLLKPENKDQLVDVLTYHVVKGNVSSEDATKLAGKDVTMFNNKPAKIEVKDGQLYIDGAKVLVKDIKAKNGTIHIIDQVMMP